MIKKVNVDAKIAIKSVTPPVYGKVSGISMTTGDIFKCLCGRAVVDEVLSDGSLVRLDTTNYNKINEVAPKAEVKIEAKVEETPVVEEVKIEEPAIEVVVEDAVELKEEAKVEEAVEEPVAEVVEEVKAEEAPEVAPVVEEAKAEEVAEEAPKATAPKKNTNNKTNKKK